MSHLKKLAIRGIRSFSPNDEEIIEFISPLTLILGQNGCGKTVFFLACPYILDCYRSIKSNVFWHNATK